jgi:hypothetical protein
MLKGEEGVGGRSEMVVSFAIIGRLLVNQSYAAFKCAYKTSVRINWQELAKIFLWNKASQVQLHLTVIP